MVRGRARASLFPRNEWGGGDRVMYIAISYGKGQPFSQKEVPSRIGSLCIRARGRARFRIVISARCLIRHECGHVNSYG